MTLLPSKKTVDVTLEDKPDWQEIAVEQPAGRVRGRRAEGEVGLRRARSTTTSASPTCSSSSPRRRPTTPRSRSSASTKIATWKKERVAAAKMFKTKLGQSLPIAAAVRRDATETRPTSDGREIADPAGDGDHIRCACRTRSRAPRSGWQRKARRGAARRPAISRAAKFATMTAVRVSVRDKRPIPDRRRVVHAEPGVLRRGPVRERAAAADHRSARLSRRAGARARSSRPDCPRSPTRSRRSRRSASATSDDLCLGAARRSVARRMPAWRRPCARCCWSAAGMVEGREGSFPAARPQLLVYGADGRLEVTSALGSAAALDWDRGADGPEAGARDRVGATPARDDARVEAVAGVVATK